MTPELTALRPCTKIASASTVAVVVPSPAWVPVFEATSRTRRAPMFWKGSRNSICSATVTPSLVTCGVPQDLWMTTLRPEGPRVLFTVRASFSTPRRMFSRTSSLNTIFLAAMWVAPVGCGEVVAPWLHALCQLEGPDDGSGRPGMRVRTGRAAGRRVGMTYLAGVGLAGLLSVLAAAGAGVAAGVEVSAFFLDE